MPDATPTPTAAPTPIPTATVPIESVQTQTVYLDDASSLTVRYEITLGDALVSILLTLLIAVQLTKWLHGLIWRRRHV